MAFLALNDEISILSRRQDFRADTRIRGLQRPVGQRGPVFSHFGVKPIRTTRVDVVVDILGIDGREPFDVGAAVSEVVDTFALIATTREISLESIPGTDLIAMVEQVEKILVSFPARRTYNR